MPSSNHERQHPGTKTQISKATLHSSSNSKNGLRRSNLAPAGRLQKSTNDGANPKASYGTTTSNDSDHRMLQNHIHLSTRSRNGNPPTKIAPVQQNPQNCYLLEC